jgi:hypothetical protein
MERRRGEQTMAGILVTHCVGDEALAEDLRSKLVDVAVPEPLEFVSLTSAVSDRPLKTEMVAAAALVVLLSRFAARDSRVMTETGLAVSLGKPVIAVIVDETPPEALDFIEAQVWIPAAAVKTHAELAREIYTVARELLPESGTPQ